MASFEKVDSLYCREISLKVNARYLGNKINLGKASSISEICICIDSRYCFPLNSDINLLLPSEGDDLSVYGRVRSTTHNHYISETVSYNILTPSEEYLKYVDGFRQKGINCKQVYNVSKGL